MYTGDVRNDKEDNTTQAFHKAAHRQFILARHGYLGRGNRQVYLAWFKKYIYQFRISRVKYYFRFRPLLLSSIGGAFEAILNQLL